MLAIARRDIASIFSSAIASIVLTIFSLILGGCFVLQLADYQTRNIQIARQAAMNPDPEALFEQVDVVEMVVVPVIYVGAVALMFIVPMITMRLFAEEKKVGTDELLLTAPLTTIQIVGGKYLAALATIAAAIVAATLPIGLLFLMGRPPWKIIASIYLGIFLLAATYAAFSLLASSLTQNQIVAAVLPFGLFLLMWVVGLFPTEEEMKTSTWWALSAYTSTSWHFEDFLKGVVDTTHLVYYVTASFLGCFLTARVIDSSRWR
ncbi:MAG: ABC transporter permease subunit [Acidobacteriota bacterium]